MKKFFKDNENRISFFLFLLTMAVAISPLMSRYCINGHDLEYHLLRIESLKEGILMGKPFLKVNALFFGGAGYASSMFYPDLFIYIPALLRAAGLGINKSYHIFLVLIFVLCYLSTYWCTYKMTSSKYMADIAAMILTLCPYRMDDILVRAACGEYMAFIFIPFVIYGLYNIVYEDMNRPYVFITGFAGLILSHPATCVLCALFAFAVLLISFKQFIAKPKLLAKFLISCLLTLALTAFYWVPMLWQMMGGHFYISDSSIDMLNEALTMQSVFSEVFPGAGVLILVFAIPRIFLRRKNHEILKYTDLMMIFGLIFAIGTTDIMPWEKLGKLCQFLQFPWRMLTMTSALMAIADAVVIILFVREELPSKESVILWAVAALSAAMAIVHVNSDDITYYDYGNDYYSYAPYTASVIGGEWLPSSVSDRDMLTELAQHMYTDLGSELSFTRERAVITAEVPENVNEISVPFIYYKGYAAALTDSNGNVNELEVSGDGIDGMCLVRTNGMSGELKVWYRGSAAITLSAVCSLLTLAALIVSAFLTFKKERAAKDA